MSVTELKKAIHNRIEAIDDQNRLEEILSLVDASSADVLSEQEIAILEERNERYLKGEEKPIAVEEFNAQLRKKYGF